MSGARRDGGTALEPALAATGPAGRPLRICFVCTHSLTLATLYKGLFPYLRAAGFEVDVIVGDREYTEFPVEHFGELAPRVIPMKRLPAPASDAVGLARFIGHFAVHRYDLIHVSTPKASLLASIAARLTFNGPVMFVYRRCVYEMMSGRKREIYRQADRLIARLSAAVVPISRRLEDLLAEEGIAARGDMIVLGAGSSNGVDTERFQPTPANIAAGERLRETLGVPAAAPVVLFLGRICREKGIDLLPPIFERVRARHPDAHLVVAGPDDARDPPAPETMRYLADTPQVHRVGFVQRTEDFYAMSTVFLFPSYFEGFGNVLLEAAGMERASVAFKVTGVTEAVADGVSGILVDKDDVEAAAQAVNDLLADPEKRRGFETRARRRAVEEFDRRRIWAELEALMRRLVAG